MCFQEKSDLESKAAKTLYTPLLETEDTFVRVSIFVVLANLGSDIIFSNIIHFSFIITSTIM